MVFEGKEKSIGEGLVSSLITVKPPRDSSSGLRGCSTESMLASTREEPRAKLVREMDWRLGGKEAVSIRAWEIVLKFRSMYKAKLRDRTRDSYLTS